MKIKFIIAAAGASWCAALGAATLSVSTAVQTQPDPSSPVITVLAAGTEQPSATDKGGAAPAGWSAVELPGPFEAYVKNKDLNKALDVVVGSTIYLAPKSDAGVLTVFQKGDKAEITGLHGGWTQLRLESPLVGYIRTGADQEVAAPPPAPGASPAAASPAATVTPAYAAPVADAHASLSRLFEGTLTPSKTLLGPRRPFKWELLDDSGKLVAYVDLTKLLLTDQIENYAGHVVVVLGSYAPVKDSADIVIEVEALRLK